MKKPVELGPMKLHLAFQVHLTWRAIRKWMLADARMGEEGVSRGSYSVPILIGINPGITPQEIASCLYLDASKVTVMLGRLERDGLIRRVPSTVDRRKVELYLTAAGEEAMKRSLVMSRRIESRWSEVLTEQEAEEFVRLLAKIRRRDPSDAE